MGKMDRKTLAGLTDRRRLSKLSPHARLICELRRSGATFGGIAKFLSKEKQVTVDPSTVFYFIRRLEQGAAEPQKARPRREKPSRQDHTPPAPAAQAAPPPTDRQASLPPAVAPQPTPPPATSGAHSNDVRQRIEALKRRQPDQKPAEKVFDYDTDKPLTLLPKDGNA
jgi:predicted lipid-binding transport protein (Tim44 family)